MDADSGALWNAFVQCLGEACPETGDAAADEACINGAVTGTCAAQVQACIGDTAGKPGAQFYFSAMHRVFTFDFTFNWLVRDYIIE